MKAVWKYCMFLTQIWLNLWWRGQPLSNVPSLLRRNSLGFSSILVKKKNYQWPSRAISGNFRLSWLCNTTPDLPVLSRSHLVALGREQPRWLCDPPSVPPLVPHSSDIYTDWILKCTCIKIIANPVLLTVLADGVNACQSFRRGSFMLLFDRQKKSSCFTVKPSKWFHLAVFAAMCTQHTPLFEPQTQCQTYSEWDWRNTLLGLYFSYGISNFVTQSTNRFYFI